MFQPEVLAISEVAKNLLLEKMQIQRIVVLVHSQAAVKALIKYTVTSITVFNCLRNLSQLGKQNHVRIVWIPGHAGVHGNKVADYIAKSESKSKIRSPEPFISVRYASCVNRVKNWSTDRWKSMRNERLVSSCANESQNQRNCLLSSLVIIQLIFNTAKQRYIYSKQTKKSENKDTVIKFLLSCNIRSLCNTAHSNERYAPITGYRKHTVIAQGQNILIHSVTTNGRTA